MLKSSPGTIDLSADERKALEALRLSADALLLKDGREQPRRSRSGWEAVLPRTPGRTPRDDRPQGGSDGAPRRRLRIKPPAREPSATPAAHALNGGARPAATTTLQENPSSLN